MGQPQGAFGFAIVRELHRDLLGLWIKIEDDV
jgi:hypothetical protein